MKFECRGGRDAPARYRDNAGHEPVVDDRIQSLPGRPDAEACSIQGPGTYEARLLLGGVIQIVVHPLRDFSAEVVNAP
jgi:hypothetical protein